MLVEGDGAPQNYLDYCRENLLIEANFFSLVKLMTWDMTANGAHTLSISCTRSVISP